jgi:hypothetical protein
MLKTVATLGGGGSTTGQLTYKGTWDANANSPTLTSSVGTLNNYYVVGTAGATNLNGITNWQVGDWAIFNGSVWEKIDGGAYGTVSQVNTGTGLSGGPITTTGTVSLANTAVTAGTYGSNTNVAQVTINAQGQITNAVNVAINIPAANVSGLGTMSTQNANNVVITGGTENAVTYTNVTISSGTFVGSNVKVSNGVYSTNTFNSTYTDGIVMDYSTGNGRISVGAGDGITFYNGGVANVALGNVTSAGVWNLNSMASANVAITGGNVSANIVQYNTNTAATATFATSSLPLVPAGYLYFNLNGTLVKVPYYGV